MENAKVQTKIHSSSLRLLSSLLWLSLKAGGRCKMLLKDFLW